MVRHYLNLSRIEGGELKPVLSRVAVLADVVAPLLESFEGTSRPATCGSRTASRTRWSCAPT